MNDLAQIQQQAMIKWAQENPLIASRGIDEATWNALKNSVYPGAKDESVLMAVDYCTARQLDPLLKPVHLVPMNVKNSQTNNHEWRDVPMPGVGLYRIQADRSGTYAGADAPEFGPTTTETFTDKNNHQVSVSFPLWCRYTVHKKIGDRIVAFTATEYWIENYATDSNKSSAPNAMWKKRPFAQLAKCAEAQALRKGWPEIGQEPTAEEMEGKEYVVKDITPSATIEAPAIAYYPPADFEANFDTWAKVIASGKKTASEIIAMVSSKGQLTEEQRQKIQNCEKAEA